MKTVKITFEHLVSFLSFILTRLFYLALFDKLKVFFSILNGLPLILINLQAGKCESGDLASFRSKDIIFLSSSLILLNCDGKLMLLQRCVLEFTSPRPRCWKVDSVLTRVGLNFKKGILFLLFESTFSDNVLYSHQSSNYRQKEFKNWICF